MSLTYPDPVAATRALDDRPLASEAAVAGREPYTPVYARSGKARNGRKSVRTWMILAPVGALVLIGGAVAMIIGGEASPADAPLPMAAVPMVAPLQAGPAAPRDVAPSPVIATPVARAPAARVATQARASVPTSRSRPQAAVAVAPVEPAPVPAPTGPQPYLSVTEAPAVTAAPPPPTPVLPPEAVTGPPLD
jgi:hypothetical protein